MYGYLVGRSVGRAVATGRDERGDKGEGRGYRTCRCMHGSNRRTDRDTEREIDGERQRWRRCADAAGMQTDDDS